MTEVQTQDVLADVLSNMQMATLVYGRMELGAPWRLQFPDKEAAHLHVVGRGSARLLVKGQPEVQLQAGDVALVPHRGQHVLSDGKGAPLQRLECGSLEHTRSPMVLRAGGHGAQTTMVAAAFIFSTARRSPLFEHLPPLVHVSAHGAGAPPHLAPLVQMMVAETGAPNAGSSVMVKRLADLLLVQVLRALMANTSCQQHGMRGLTDPHVGRALSLIHERWAHPWTVESLASTVGLSRSGFAARFSQLVGEPPLEYVARWRMMKAAELLRHGSFSVGEVADRVGYRSEPAFNRAFKRWEGRSPGAYRKLHAARPR
ncbi:MAG: AraC family transcriptional regulator [Myxococcota bacterium]